MWQRGSGIDCDDVCQSQPPALHSITQWNSCSPYDMRPGHWTLNTGHWSSHPSFPSDTLIKPLSKRGGGVYIRVKKLMVEIGL